MDFINPEKMVFIREIDSDEMLLKHIQYITKNLAGEKFVITQHQIKVISGLIYYFNGNVDEAKKRGMDICKGIGLIGKYGSGKTTLFKLIHEYLHKTAPGSVNTFKITSIDEIIQNMMSSDNYMDGVYFFNVKAGINNEQIRKPIHLCINEFGVQYDIRRYGSDVNDLIDSLMMRRYEIFQQYGKVTHITSNFGTAEFEKRFPERLVDRFREMFNIVKLEGKSFRR